MAPKRKKTISQPTKDELRAILTNATATFEAALAEYHRMPCTSTENARRAAYALQEKAYAAAEAAGIFNVVDSAF